MDRPDPFDAARALVAERHPGARQAWLCGSVVLGGATSTSDLDVTVLLDEVVVRRESLSYAGWPVELFVHTEASVRHFVDQDRARRRPTMARLVASGVALVEGPGGAALQEQCAAVVRAGPGPMSAEALDSARYLLTDLLDDLAGGPDVGAGAGAGAGARVGAAVGGGPGGVLDAVVVDVWRGTAELLLAADERWSGSGKWLLRELQAADRDAGTTHADLLARALRAALSGDAGPLVGLADEALARVGGRLWSGFRQDALLPAGLLASRPPLV